jgi:hypothetical protein
VRIAEWKTFFGDCPIRPRGAIVRSVRTRELIEPNEETQSPWSSPHGLGNPRRFSDGGDSFRRRDMRHTEETYNRWRPRFWSFLVGCSVRSLGLLSARNSGRTVAADPQSAFRISSYLPKREHVGEEEVEEPADQNQIN